MKRRIFMTALVLAALLLPGALEAACPRGTIHCCSTNPPICRWPCSKPCQEPSATAAPAVSEEAVATAPGGAASEARLLALYSGLFEPLPAAGSVPANTEAQPALAVR